MGGGAASGRRQRRAAELLREAVRGNGGSILIEGEPGVGKSALLRGALLQETPPEPPGGEVQVCWGTGDELAQSLPLVPFLDAFQVRTLAAGSARRQMIVRFLDGDDSAERGADVPAILAEQLLALITEDCARHPVILVIDDLQWADTASVRLWGRLARIAGKLPLLLLVGAMRPVPLRADLLALRRMAATTTVRLRLAGWRWTLAQCRMLSGQAEVALSVLGQSLADSARPARHRPQMLALAARAQFRP